jgi:hypothetical protein
MKVGFWKLKVAAAVGNTRHQPIWYDNQSDHPIPGWIFLPYVSPLSGIGLATHKEGQYDRRYSSHVSIWLQSRGSNLILQIVLVVGKNAFHSTKFSKLILCTGFHGFGLLTRFVAKKFPLPFLS